MRKKQKNKANLINKPSALKALLGKRITIGDYYDYPLLFCIGILMAIGVVMVYSASLYAHNTSFLKKQMLFAVGGFGIITVLSLIIDYKVLNKKRVWMASWIIGAGSCLFVFLLDKAVNGASRWFRIFGVSIQPSEFAKIFTIIAMAYVLSTRSHQLNKLLPSLLCTISAIPIIMAVYFNDLSTSLVIIAIVAVMLFTISEVPFQLIFTALGTIPVFGIYMFLHKIFGSSDTGYRIGRFKIWMDPFAAGDLGRQIRYSMYSIATGGFFGKGFGQGMAKLGLSEAYNDTIFSVICEELGVFGAIALLAVYVILIWRIIRIAVNAPDLFASLLCIGVAVHVSIQVLFHIGVCTNFFPNTGMTLPFVSYGGSSMLALCIELGLVLAVSRLIGVKKQEA
ncbi:MAG: FtsW/RodA/SpoVE family cell cycle protein [Lachnospiraceae bacterium]|nr:FtsW/RodA/SpoVE family cell cycle protein [Lachnospiraceae bacterium]